MKEKTHASLYQDTLIEGVKILPLRTIPDERGAIYHGVRKEQLLNDFGEVYFSKIYPGAIKGWHVHETLELNYICVHGMIKLVLHDLRKKSKTYGVTQEFFMGDDNHILVHIPAGVANGSKGFGATPFSLVANVASHAHDPSLKYKRIDPHGGEIDYNWDRKDF